MILTKDIIKDHIIDRLNNKVKVVSAGALVNGVQTIKLCSIKWLGLYNEFLSGEKVINISGESVDVETSTAFNVGDILEIKIPLFFHGNPYTTIEEWHNFSTQEKVKLPFIWYVTPSNETHNEPKQSIKRTSDVKLFFVHWSNWQKLNNDRVSESIQPLQNLVEEFMHASRKNTAVFDGYDNYRTREFPKFGNTDSNGVTKVLMNSTLAGVELTTTLKILNLECKKC